MAHIAIISGSVRIDRRSHRVALYFKKFIEEHQLATVEILDLMEYDFPLFNERLHLQKDPLPKTKEFAEKIVAADGVLLVTPEYNGGYPASVKNVTDLLYNEWKRKPLAITTVSNGPFGGTQVITSLLFTLWKIGAWIAPAMFPVPKVNESFDENGNAIDKEATDKRATVFINELMWCIHAKEAMS